MRQLKELHPIACKDHICDFCWCRIDKGQRYYRQTGVNDEGQIYDFTAHEECCDLATELDMYNQCDDEGLDAQTFQDTLDQYIYDNYSEEEADSICGMLPVERVRRVLKDLETEKNSKKTPIQGTLTRIPTEWRIKNDPHGHNQ